jgi:hypothetical protein
MLWNVYKGRKKPKIMGISKQPSPIKVTIDEKQPENVEYSTILVA